MSGNLRELSGDGLYYVTGDIDLHAPVGNVTLVETVATPNFQVFGMTGGAGSGRPSSISAPGLSMATTTSMPRCSA